jgi:phosphate transport system permease protein
LKAFVRIGHWKRIVIASLVAALVLLLFLPIATIVVQDGTGKGSQPLSLLSIPGLLKDVGIELGITSTDTTGIDPANPADDSERAMLVLDRAATDFGNASLALYGVLLFVLLASIVLFVKPRSITGLVLAGLSTGSLALSGFLARDGFDAINRGIGLLRDYFGLSPDLAGLSFALTPLFFLAVGVSALIPFAGILLRNEAPDGTEGEKVARTVALLCAIVATATVVFITLFLVAKGLPTILKIGIPQFLFSGNWDPLGETPSFGIGNMILTSFIGTAGAIVIGVPIGLLSAAFISQLAPKRSKGFLLATVNLLAGIPSVIYGAVGLIVLVPFVQKVFGLPTGMSLFSAIIVLSVMVLPTIISVSTTSLDAVPVTLLEASLALGLTKEASIYRILLPAARSGIMTGVLLGLGRAIGEAMAILLVAGNVAQFPELLQPVRFLTTGIVAEMGYATGLHRDVLFAIGLILFFFILVLNSFFRYLLKKAGERYGT